MYSTTKAAIVLIITVLGLGGIARAQEIQPPEGVSNPADVCYASDWDRKSTYDGTDRVRGCGKLLNLAGLSRSQGRVTDLMRDGNKSYGYTTWQKLEYRCTTAGVSHYGTYESTTCSSDVDPYSPVHREATAEVSDLSNTTWTWDRDWCDSNGNDCALNGYKVVAGACAQMGSPVPNSCTHAYVEFHMP